MEGLQLVPPTLLRSTDEVRYPCLRLACLLLAKRGWGQIGTAKAKLLLLRTDTEAVHKPMLSGRPRRQVAFEMSMCRIGARTLQQRPWRSAWTLTASCPWAGPRRALRCPRSCRSPTERRRPLAALCVASWKRGTLCRPSLWTDDLQRTLMTATPRSCRAAVRTLSRLLLLTPPSEAPQQYWLVVSSHRPQQLQVPSASPPQTAWRARHRGCLLRWSPCRRRQSSARSMAMKPGSSAGVWRSCCSAS